jgi:tetratricopeptide (TPR) repeat protein
MAYLKLGEFKLVVEDCSKSLELDDKYVKSYLRRATALKKLKKYKESLCDYNKVIELDSTSNEAKD